MDKYVIVAVLKPGKFEMTKTGHDGSGPQAIVT